MNNKGYITVTFSLVISVLLLFTLTALEVGRINLSTVKIKPCVHSMRSSMMADYHEELFERYHLLFWDPTYGTGSEAVAEEKITDYIETSLNGEDGDSLDQFQLEEVALSNKKTILSDDMKLLKEQIDEYEKTIGVARRIEELTMELTGTETDIEKAATETSTNGKELNLPKESKEESADTSKKEEKTELQKEDVKDPREGLKKSLKFGILAFVAPDKEISKEKKKLSHMPSEKYQEEKQQEKNNRFDDIGFLNTFLSNRTQENIIDELTKKASFVSYITSYFSNGVNEREDCVMKCEVEYILEGKDSDYENLEEVAEEITWVRMPVNYVYLLSDMEKKSQALTLATAISIVTGTESFVEIIKYLLLGCWAYGESLHEVKVLLSGEQIPYIKTKETWYTDLETLTAVNKGVKEEKGLSYDDFLMILLAKKSGASLDKGYARILDVIEMNIRQEQKSFRITDCVGSVQVQGKISMNPLFYKGKDEAYDYYFEETICYQ